MKYLLAILFFSPCMAEELKHDNLPIKYAEAQDIMAKKKIDGKSKHPWYTRFFDMAARRDDVQALRLTGKTVVNQYSTAKNLSVKTPESGQDRPMSKDSGYSPKLSPVDFEVAFNTNLTAQESQQITDRIVKKMGAKK